MPSDPERLWHLGYVAPRPQRLETGFWKVEAARGPPVLQQQTVVSVDACVARQPLSDARSIGVIVAAFPYLKTWRPLAGDFQGAFQGQAGAGDCAFVEEPSNQRDSVRNSARWREFGQGPTRVGRPIAAGL